MHFNHNNFKRIISISAAAMCMISALRFAPASENEAFAADTLTAFEITEDMQIGWNLGNSLDATVSGDTATVDSELAWGNPKTTQELIDAIKAKGFNTVRIPTTWYQHLDADNNIDPAWMARVHEVVDYCYNNDMYVILNLHHENWVNRADLGTAYDEMQPKLLKIWQQIADEFTDYDQRLIFECMNEPRAVDTDHEWWGPQQSEVDCINQLNADFVELIRNDDSPYNDTRLLMIPGYCASSDITMISKIVVPEDEYVAVSIHAYSPYNFTMNAEVEDHSVFTDAYATELTTILEGIRSTFIEKDIPVVIGEFSASNYDNTEARCEWADLYISTTKEMGIPCVLWDNDARGNTNKAERHDWINRDTLEWYEDSVQVVDKMMSVLADDTIVWGGNKMGTQYTHDDITTGVQLLSEPAELDSSLAASGGNCTPGLNATWAQLEGGEVAVQYTGDTPVVAVVNGDWENWTEIKPYDIDEENGIAYFSSEHIAAAWSGETSEIEHIFARTNSTTTVTAVAILGSSNVVDDLPEDNTKKYPIDLTDADRSGTLVLHFEGTAGAAPNGCVGYMGDEWTNIEWEGVVGSDGTLDIEISLADIPESVTAAEAQIWWAAEEVDMVSYEIVTESATEPTTEPTTAPTTGASGEYGDADCNGVLDVNDVVKVMCYSINPDAYPLLAEGKYLADVYQTGDGVNSSDAFSIQKKLVNLITVLPEA